jgi:exopolyphosphatase / guanosine-5'-triphosphate,3'-diphosphate pyrophosphatase
MPGPVAVVDLGTNSTRLLVAEVRDGAVAELERRTNVTRLGQDVDATGRLAEEAVERVFAAVGEYREAIDRHGAERTIAIATSAVRDAANGEEFREALRERFGLDARTISGDEESRLTFLGATSGVAIAGKGGRPEAEAAPGGTEPRSTLVLDIGGGSTEFVCGTPGEEPAFHVSTALGSVRQTERHLRGDPPEHTELEALAQEVRATIVAEVPERVRADTGAGIAVAGTPTSLAAIDQELDPYDPERVHGYELSLGTCERMQAMLAALSVAERRELAGLHPDRAPTIVAGVVILVEAMRSFGLDAMTVSEADLLHGAALSAARSGGG